KDVIASGKLTTYRNRLRMASPTTDILRGGEDEAVHTGRIIPVHPATEGVSPGMIRRLVYEALRRIPEWPDPLPDAIRRNEGLIEWENALRGVHFPSEWSEKDAAVERLKFDELFTLELGVAFRKRRLARQEHGIAHLTGEQLEKRFLSALPFELTAGQRGALEAVARSMAEPH